MDKAEKRLARSKALLADIHRRLGLQFGFRLWDGALVPADWPAGALTIAVADKGAAVAGLARAPRLTSLANLWAARRLEVVNGALFDIAAKRPKARSRELHKSLATPAAFRLALSFLFTPRGGPWPLEAIAQDRKSDGCVYQTLVFARGAGVRQSRICERLQARRDAVPESGLESA